MSDLPRRIQLSRKRGWRLPAGAVNCARPGRWGNPYKIGAEPYMTRDMCVALFETLLTTDIADADVGPEAAAYRRWNRAHIHELRGKDLACWCPLPMPYETDRCHAAVLLRLANGAV